MQRSREQVFQGEWSLLIDNSHDYDRPVSNNWFQQVSTPPVGKTVRIRAAVRTEKATAANVCLQCWSADGGMIGFASTPPLRGSHDWKAVFSGPVRIPEGTKHVVVRAALTGTGRVWFDDVSVQVVDLENAAASPVLVAARPQDSTERPLSNGQVGSATSPSKNVRGICVLSSRIGKDVSPGQIVAFARSCRLNLVVIDFAWISHHWPQTTDAAVDLAGQLQDAGIEVMLMYRPRVMDRREADVHYLPGADIAESDSRLSLDFVTKIRSAGVPTGAADC